MNRSGQSLPLLAICCMLVAGYVVLMLDVANLRSIRMQAKYAADAGAHDGATAFIDGRPLEVVERATLGVVRNRVNGRPGVPVRIDVSFDDRYVHVTVVATVERSFFLHEIRAASAAIADSVVHLVE